MELRGAPSPLDGFASTKHRRRDAEPQNGVEHAALRGMVTLFSSFASIASRMMLVAGLAVTTGASLAPAAARPLVPAERRYSPYSGELPACGDPAVFERIQWRFRDRESDFWNTGLEIASFENVREIGYKTNGEDYIPRRYCTALAYLNDEKKPREVSYSINEDLGLLGYGFGVEWCVGGLDRNDAYAPNCKMARP